jgi:hypothetical protein
MSRRDCQVSQAIATICFVVAYGFGVCVHPGHAEEGGLAEFQFGELIDCGDTISNYFDEVAAAGEPPTYPGLEQAIRDKYEKVIRKLNAFEDRSVVDVEVSNDSEKNQVLIEVAFRIQKENRTAAANFDFSQLSRCFKKSAMPVKFEIDFDGAYSFGINNVSDLASISPSEAMESNAFFVFDHLVMELTASGNDTDLRLFPAGFTTQVFVLGDLELRAEPQAFAFAYRLSWVLSGGDEEGILSGSDLQNNNFKFGTEQKTTCEGLFTLSHRNAAGSLSLAAQSENLEEVDATRLRLTGTLAFPMLTFGQQITLTDATLTFDGSADWASLRAVARRAHMASLLQGADEKATNKKKSPDCVSITGTYDFAARSFEGFVDDLPMKFAGALIPGRK